MAQLLSGSAKPHLGEGSDVVLEWPLALQIVEADQDGTPDDRDDDGEDSDGASVQWPAWLADDDRYWLAETLRGVLPEPTLLVLELGSRGVRGKPGYALTACWTRANGHEVTPQPTRHGPGSLLVEGQERRLSLAQLRALDAMQALPTLGQSRDGDLESTATVLAAASGNEAAGVRVGPGLRTENVQRVDAIQPRLAPVGNERYQVRPRVPGVDDEALWQALRKTPQSSWATGVKIPGESRQRTRLVLGPEAIAGLKDVVGAGAKHLNREQVAQVLAEPQRFLGTHMDLSALSERVTGVGPIIMEVRQEASESAVGDWLNWDFSLETLDGSEGVLLDLGDPSVVTALEGAIAFADQTEVAHIPNPSGPGLIQLTRTLREAVVRARARLSAEEEGAEPVVREGLIVRENFEEVEYRPEMASQEAVALRQPVGLVDGIRLRDHQLHGLAWLRGLAGSSEGSAGGILADDMGLGKTLQVLALWSELLAEGRPGPHLVVAPVALLHNWHKEARRFFGERLEPVMMFAGSLVRQLGASQVARMLADYRVVLVSYESLRANERVFAAVRWETVVLDEAQKAKNPTTQIARVVRTLDARLRLAVTGTPVENTLRDMWALFDFAIPGLLGSLRGFRERYIVPLATGADDDLRASLATRLTGKIQDVFLRRMKEQVLDDLPALCEHDHPVALGPVQEAAYVQVLREVRQGIRTSLGSLTALFGLCAHPDLGGGPLRPMSEVSFPKAEALFRILAKVAAAGEKALIFAGRRDIQHWLAGEIAARFQIRRPYVINGQINGSLERLRRVEDFEAQPGFSCLVLAPRAAGVGLNIVGANHVIHYMREWNPAVEKQATDRCYRIGQTREVHVHTITCSSEQGVTVEARLAELLEAKRALIREFTVPMGECVVSQDELVNAEGWRDAVID